MSQAPSPKWKRPGDTMKKLMFKRRSSSSKSLDKHLETAISGKGELGKIKQIKYMKHSTVYY